MFERIKIAVLMRALKLAVDSKSFGSIILAVKNIASYFSFGEETEAFANVLKCCAAQDWNGVCLALSDFFKELAVNFAKPKVISMGIEENNLSDIIDVFEKEDVQFTAEPAGIDPATILAIIGLLIKVAEWVRKRKEDI